VFKAFKETSDSSQGAEDMAEFSQVLPNSPFFVFRKLPMPSFDVLLEPDMVAIKHSVENTKKEVGTRFDFKGTSAALELKEKEKEIQLIGDGDFQIEQISTVLLGKLTKQNVQVSFLDMTAKLEKIGGDKVRQMYKIKAGIDAPLAKKIVTSIKDAKLKVQASIQGDTVRITGKNRDDLQVGIAQLKKDFPDQPLKYDNFRD
jgi:cyclic-di-GMP-binding protein